MKTCHLSQGANLCAALWLATLSAAPAQTGVPLWSNRYNGPANLDDRPTAVAVDSSGNVFVTGESFGPDFFNSATIKYSSAGVPLWTNRDRGIFNAAATDSNGDVVVAGNGGTIKYSSAGVPLWTNRWEEGAETEARAIALDNNDNVIVTGLSSLDYYMTMWDYVTVKYSSAGMPLWTNRYDGPGHNRDYASAVAVDGSGNVFVTGSSVAAGSTANFDYATIKYSPMGAQLWVRRYNGPANDDDLANALAVDANCNVFVTGYSYANGCVTIKYSDSGVPLCTNVYRGPGYAASGQAIAVDGSGNVIVTGDTRRSVGLVPVDYATVKYSNDGIPLWTNRYGPANTDDSAQPVAVAVDGSGNVFVAGYSYGFAYGSADFVTIGYSGAGVALWTNRYDGPGNGDDKPFTRSCLAVGPDGSVYITGGSDGDVEGVNVDYVTIRYSGAATLPIPLTHEILGSQLVLSWTNAAFSLQSAPAAQGTYTNIRGATSPHTNALPDTQQFFRLKGD